MFNQAILKQLETDVGKDVLGQLFAVFSSEATNLTERIMATTTLNDDTIRFCHSLKSCARSYGADPLGAVAESLETMAKNNDATFFSERETLFKVHQATLAALPQL